MPCQNIIFLNLPVSDLKRSLKFYTALGFVQNKTFSDDNSTMVSLPLTPDSDPQSSPIKMMIMTHHFFSSFLPQGIEIANPSRTAQSIVCFSRESREAVDEMVRKAEEAGGKINIREMTDIEKNMEKRGFHGAAFADPDGNILECVYMPQESWEGKE